MHSDLAPKTLELVSKSVSNARIDLGFTPVYRSWSMLDNVSIDYAIMEKAQNLVAVPYASKWSDLGGWNAVWSESNRDLLGNVLSDTAHALNVRIAYCVRRAVANRLWV